MKQNQTLFANFICKFGEQNLLDFAREIVVPAFTDDTLVRGYGRSNMHFLDVEIVDLQDEIAVAGKFIYNTVLTRTHIFEAGVGHVENVAALESSPSAFFVLMLSTHRMVYFAETPHAPELEIFERTVSQFLQKKYEAFIRNIRAHESANNRRVTLKQLREAIGQPELKIVPLTNANDIREFVQTYARVTKFEIVVHRRNDEIDSASTMEGLDQIAERVSAPQAKVILSDAQGLDVDGVTETLEEVLPQGNQTATLTGIDQEGNPLKGSNDKFSVKPVFDHVLPGTRARAVDLYNRFRRLVGQGVITAPPPNAQALDVARNQLADDVQA